MTAHAAVSIYDDFPSGESSVAMRSADDETAGRIDMEFGLRIHHPRGNDRINDVFLDVGAELVGAHIIAMLRGNDYGVDAAPRLKVLEVNEPEKRRAGARVANAVELVQRLRERGVI